MPQNDHLWEQLNNVSFQEATSSEQGSVSLENLRREVSDLRQANADLEILLETTTEHSTRIETELQEKNETMEEYLRHVYCVTAAAAAVEEGTFQSSMLASVIPRDDQLGQLARMFQSMVAQVKHREETLKRQVEELKIEIDQTRRVQQVSQITQTEYFKELKQKAKQIRGSFGS
ncbi:MAG: hypothetical protein KME42_02380 [Tildeniella nuda ZEHNDER 1965/U140]|jgi:DNA repair ATPase RecN|nr:hypothetical protein [Tildeniella nuda ZEHNDER 1965/U140]